MQKFDEPNVCLDTCGYYVEATNSWADSGCSLYYRNDSHMICHCNHLTNFASMLDAPLRSFSNAGYDPLLLYRLMLIFCRNNIKNTSSLLARLTKKPVAIIFILAIYLFYGFAMVMAFYFDAHRDISKLVEYLYSLISDSNDFFKKSGISKTLNPNSSLYKLTIRLMFSLEEDGRESIAEKH